MLSTRGPPHDTHSPSATSGRRNRYAGARLDLGSLGGDEESYVRAPKILRPVARSEPAGLSLFWNDAMSTPYKCLHVGTRSRG
jgi:hypothetical protein